MEKRKIIITKSVSIFFYVVAVVLILISLIKRVEYDSSKIMGAMLGLCALSRFLVYFVNLDYLKKKNLHAGILNGSILVFSIVCLIAIIDAEVAAKIFAIFDLVSGALGIIISSICIKHYRLDLVELIIGVGEVVFGTLLLIEGAEGISTHLIFETVALILTIGVISFEMAIELKKLKE
ncbi:MAG: hypothetical protein MJ217_01410 [Bacilli bacterium]|nr:hypothetical protein [Bacilli bacterium]